jgi:hypothetical protein
MGMPLYFRPADKDQSEGRHTTTRLGAKDQRIILLELPLKFWNGFCREDAFSAEPG